MTQTLWGEIVGRSWLRRAFGRRRDPDPRRISLALQGGGAHGAFTWGVLDRLSEVDGLGFEGVSGTSAGAINAVVFASGWLAGGAEGARTNLRDLWRGVADAARPLRTSGVIPAALDATTQLLSPYQLNPFGLNPLRELLVRLVDFERLRRERSLRLFIAATNLRTGALRLFENNGLTVDAVLASACLPSLHHAIEIDGERYWDGGYVSNPPLLPLVDRCRAREILLVRINPAERCGLPTSARDIRNRIGEIVFDQPLERELELLEARCGAPAGFGPTGWRPVRHRLHVIDGRETLAALDPITKVMPDWRTLEHLRQLGHAAASAWLEPAPAPPLPEAGPGIARPLPAG
jgi:NTE family protein